MEEACVRTCSGRVCRVLSSSVAASDAEAWEMLLRARGLEDADARAVFLQPALTHLPDPARLADAMRAAERMAAAIARGERIHIFGDFDCDGVVGTAMLASAIRAFGGQASWSVAHRTRDGHEIPLAAIQQAAEEGARVGISVDLGSSSHEAAEAARALGLDWIVCDHHEFSPPAPRAFAFVNPKRADAGSFSQEPLCGAGVAFLLLVLLRRALVAQGREEARAVPLWPYLPHAALATVGDVMPLVGAARVLVAAGLDVLRRHPPVWAVALAQVARRRIEELSARDLAFQFAPRINAAGRLAHAERAVRLLLAEDADEAARLAQELEALNQKRRRLEEALAKEIAKALGDGVAAFGEDWHPGLVGLAAGRIARTRGHPVAVGYPEADGIRISVRSPEGWHVRKMLERCRDLLVRFGGHARAGGAVVRHEAWDDFRARFAELVRAGGETETPALVVDAALQAEAVTPWLARRMEAMEPTGEGNPKPLWLLHGAEILARREMARGALRLIVAPRTEVVAFSAEELAKHLVPGVRLHLVGRVELNRWNGSERAQFVLEDAAPVA